MNLIEPNMDFTGEEATDTDFVLYADNVDWDRISRKDEEPTCSSSMPAHGGLAQDDASLLSPSGSERCLKLTETGQQMEFPTEGSRNEHLLPSLKRQQLERNASKVKGTSSIRSFFQSRSTYPLKNHDHGAIAHTTTSSSSSRDASIPFSGFHLESGGCSEAKQAGVRTGSSFTEPGNSCGSCNASNGGPTSDWWGGYKIDEIDDSVVDELPPEIQKEVRAWLRPQKRANNTLKGALGIARYFSPSKKG